MDLPFSASQEDIVRDADILLSGYCLASGTPEEQDALLKRISDSVEAIDDCAKYVNQGSREHLVLSCLSSFLNELFYHISLEEMKEEELDFNIEERLNDCYAFAELECKDKIRKWRKKPETIVDENFEKNLARILTYALVSKNVNFDIENVLQAENTLRVRFDAGDCVARIISYLHNKDTKYNAFEILKDQIYKSIFMNNCNSSFVNFDDIEKEIQCLELLKENGIDGMSLQRFIGFYLRNAVSEVNCGKDSNLVNAILLNLSSLMSVGGGSKLDFEDDLNVFDIINSFDNNYTIAKENPKVALMSALAIDGYMSDFDK